MENPILDEIVSNIVSKLKIEYGYCGLAESPEFALINSDDGKGKDIKITIIAKSFRVEDA